MKSPYHLSDKEVTKAQNWIIDSTEREGAPRKRPGLVKHNTVALAGSVRGWTHVPLVDVDGQTETLYVAIDASVTANTNTWRTSTNGTTWSNATTPARALERDKVDTVFSVAASNKKAMGNIVSYAGKIYYPADAFTQYPTASSGGIPLRVYDGTTDAEVIVFPVDIDAGASTNPQLITAMVMGENKLYIATSTENVNDYVKVYQYDIETGQIKQVGPGINAANLGVIATMTWFEGKLWVGTASDSGGIAGTVRYIRPPSGQFAGDTAWTTDYTATSEGDILSITSFRGRLFAGISNDTDTINVAARVKVRSSAGVWSNSDTGTNGAYSQYASLIVYNDNLYAVRWHNTGSALVVRRFDNSTWTTDYDIAGNQAGAEYIGQGYVFNSRLYYVVADTGTTAGVILENNAGTWTERDTGIAYRGYIGSTLV